MNENKVIVSPPGSSVPFFALRISSLVVFKKNVTWPFNILRTAYAGWCWDDDVQWLKCVNCIKKLSLQTVRKKPKAFLDHVHEPYESPFLDFEKYLTRYCSFNYYCEESKLNMRKSWRKILAKSGYFAIKVRQIFKKIRYTKVCVLCYECGHERMNPFYEQSNNRVSVLLEHLENNHCRYASRKLITLVRRIRCKRLDINLAIQFAKSLCSTST